VCVCIVGIVGVVALVHLLFLLGLLSLTLRMSVVNVWRDEEEVGVGDVWKGRSARALAWGDVDPH
jgi:hypothetical protein